MFANLTWAFVYKTFFDMQTKKETNFDAEINVQTQTAVRPILEWGMELHHTWSSQHLDELLEDLEEAYLLSNISNDPKDRDNFLVFRNQVAALIKILDYTTENEAKLTCEFILTLCKPVTNG